MFLVTKNLSVGGLVEGNPWDFTPDKELLEKMRRLPKPVRRKKLLDPKTDWQVYSAVCGAIHSDIISKTNPPVSLRGLVVDYDAVSDIDYVEKMLNQMPESQMPNWIEITLSRKIRLVWLFEKPILIPSPAFFAELMEQFFKTMGIPTLLAGYDAASLKQTERWTNGGEWLRFRTEPLSWDFCFGVICSVSKKSSLFENGEVPLEKIAEEMAKRWPGRWKGDFVLDSLGVRFWEATADNPTGCQVKPDGMLCFTGKEPFVKWATLFGVQWYEEQRVLNLGRAACDIYFDGQTYYEHRAGRWEDIARVDIILRLSGRGLSGVKAKGATQSDIERVLDFIQQTNRVQGCAPLINKPKGIVELDGRRILNIADLHPTQPIAGETGKPELDFPWLWRFLNGLFTHPELFPLDHFLGWLQRAYRNVLQYHRFMGQACFLAGPKNCGKSLLCFRVIAPLLGNRLANPLDYMVGDTSFNSELFSAALLAINDDSAPGNEAARRKMLSKIKGMVVNPQHKYHPKFEKATTIDWQGRIFITLNDDVGSLGMLMEIEANTQDKAMFFASQSYDGVFPPQEELEPLIEKELPRFAHWLLAYKPPQAVVSNDRMGIKSYFDPRILELAHSQTFSSNLEELLKVWVRSDAVWEGKEVWEGTPTDLLTCLQGNDLTATIARDWTQPKVLKALIALAKHTGSCVSFADDSGRYFKIKKQV